MRLPFRLRFWSMLLVLTLPLGPALAFPAQPLLDDSSSKSMPWNDRQKNQPPIPPTNGGGRGGLCALSPVQLPGVAMVWSDRPLFVWHGPAAKLEVFTADGEFLWETTNWESLPSGVFTSLYEGPELDPSGMYEWRIYPARTPQQPFVFGFDMLSASDSQQLEAELASFESSLDESEIPDGELPLAYVSFFAERNLWAEALRVAFAEPPSEAVEQYQQQVLETCSPSP